MKNLLIKVAALITATAIMGNAIVYSEELKKTDEINEPIVHSGDTIECNFNMFEGESRDMDISQAKVKELDEEAMPTQGDDIVAVEENDEIEVLLITDKNKYSSSEQIVATLTIKNTNNVVITNLLLQNLIPEGYKLSNDSDATKQVEVLDVGESVALTVTYMPNSTFETNNGNFTLPPSTDNNQVDNPIVDENEVGDTIQSGTDNNEIIETAQPSTDDNKIVETTQPDNDDTTEENITSPAINDNDNFDNSSSENPSTGNNSNPIFLLVLIVFAGVGIIVTMKLDKKKRNSILSLFLCIAMLMTFIPSLQAYGANTKDTTQIQISKKVEVGENMITLTAIITYDAVSISERDADEDGLSDLLEDLLGTDKDKIDTDGDGLSDYEEFCLTGTDPILFDTNEDGIDDGNADIDGDGLTNLEEIRLNTNPTVADTDSDGLKDYDEVYIYGTNPLQYDTDGDCISDSDEILLGLDPLNPKTDGVTPDSKRTFDQVLSSDAINESLLSENDAIPSIFGIVPDNINNHVSLNESEIYALNDNRALVGKEVYIDTDYDESSSLQLSFDCTSVSERIQNLMICSYDNGNIEPYDTEINGNSLYADVTSGYYFVLDVEMLLEELDIPIEKYLLRDTSITLATTDAPKNLSNNVSDEWYDENYTLIDEGYVLSSSLYNSMSNEDMAIAKSNKISGQADIVFVIDSTGSMSKAINNVVNNIDNFVDALVSNYSVHANFALIDFKDITCDEETVLIKNGSSNWFSDVSEFKSHISQIYVDGGGDTDETPIDALGMASELDFRQTANKFVILVTDAGYKTDNNYGFTSMEEITEKFSSMGIVTSVISDTYYKSDYYDLYFKTNGVFGDIYGDFWSVLLQLAENIGGIVNDGSWVILSDFQYIKLDKPLSDDNYSSDADELSDANELGEAVEKDLTFYIYYLLTTHRIPVELYTDQTAITVYNYKSNPILPDTDFDGIIDGVDTMPKNGTFSGNMLGYYNVLGADYIMDYREFFNSKYDYSKKISKASLIFANTIYNNSGYKYASNATSILNIEELMKYHGFKNVIDYKLADGYNKDGISCTAYTDDDISEIGIGYHDVTYKGMTKTILGVVIRGTDGSIEEWSSNFDMGDPDLWYSEYHKGFYITEERIKNFVDKYFNRYLKDKSNVVYWITGHSRGAALANILSARLIDEGNDVFAYTFATPSTTISTSKNDAKYSSIFNFANTSDFVTYVPLEQWGFGRFGNTKLLSIEDSNLQITWSVRTGNDNYNALNKNVITLATNRIAKSCSKTWNEVFDRAGSQDINDDQYKCISERAKRYCDIVERNSLFGKHLGYKLYPSTAFIFQLGAEALAGSDEEKENVVVIIKELWNSKYTGVLLLFLGDAVTNFSSFEGMTLGETLVGDGHAPATYYVLIDNNKRYSGGGGAW